MRYLSPGFVGEGPTDYRFVRTLVARHLESLLLAESEEVVEIGPVVEILPGDHYGNSPKLVADEIVQGRLALDILFVHADAGGHPDRVREFIIDPIEASLSSRSQPSEVVAVVPDKETEAWMLADTVAVAAALGLTDVPTEGIRPRRVHTIADPKLELEQLVTTAFGADGRSRPVRRGSSRLNQLYSSLADEVRLDHLREVPAFLRYESELREVLRRLGLID